MTIEPNSGFTEGARSPGLAEQLAARLALRIDQHALKPGTRLPSIRDFAAQQTVSRSTVVDAYERLIARGLIESRRGSGFYVSTQRSTSSKQHARGESVQNLNVDVVWLLRSMLRQADGDQPGAGLLPSAWLESEMVMSAVRGVGRGGGSLLGYGRPEGYLPLREQIAQRLSMIEIEAGPMQVVTTSGVTQAIDLVARHFLRPGDAVLVEDPAWYLMFARFAAFGAKVIGVPRLASGPDITVLVNLLSRHKPKLFVVGSVLHNPTSSTMSAATAHQLVKLADQYQFTILEDDIYGDLYAGRANRLASLDQLRRVIYVSGFSKTLAAGLRVGYIAASPELAGELADLKMLTGLTTPELTERVVSRVLAEGAYRRYLERLRSRADTAREKTARALEKMGARLFAPPLTGIFLWADFQRDTNVIAAAAAQQDILCAPGSLFSPSQLPSHWMRVSAAATMNPAAMRFLAQAIAS